MRTLDDLHMWISTAKSTALELRYSLDPTDRKQAQIIDQQLSTMQATIGLLDTMLMDLQAQYREASVMVHEKRVRDAGK